MNPAQASGGVGWLRGGIALVRQAPGTFLAMGLIIAIIGRIPFLGSILGLILAPVFIGGTIHAARGIARGEKPAIGEVFQAFTPNGRLGPLITLSMPILVALLTLLLVIGVFLVGAGVPGDQAAITWVFSSTDALLASFGAGGVAALFLIGLVLVGASHACVFFAIPLVALGTISALHAMRASLAAVARNLGGFILLDTIFIFGSFWLAVLLRDVAALGEIGSVITSALFYACAGPVLYVAGTGVFGAAPEPAPAQGPPSA